MFGLPSLPRTLAAALRDISSKKPEVRGAAIRDLVRHCEDSRAQVIRAIEEGLRDEDPRVRGLAATALADTEAKESLAALLLAVEDEDRHVREMAISALGEIGDRRAAGRLERALTDPRPEVRFQAIVAFSRVVEKDDAHDAVLRAMEDEDGLVVHIALRVAEELADGRPVDPRALAKAKTLLSHKSPTVQLAAAIVLARAGDRSGEAIIAKVVLGELETEDGEDEAAAIELAGELGLKTAQRGLVRRAFGGLLGLGRDRYRWHARVALAAMGDPRATSEILAELSSWDRQRRTLAVAAAGRARIRAAREQIAGMLGAPETADPDAVDEALRNIDSSTAFHEGR